MGTLTGMTWIWKPHLKRRGVEPDDAKVCTCHGVVSATELTASSNGAVKLEVCYDVVYAVVRR